jgi:hypothetical protein
LKIFSAFGDQIESLIDCLKEDEDLRRLDMNSRSEPGNVGKEYGGVRKQVSDRRIVNFTPSSSPSDKNDLRRSLPDVKPPDIAVYIWSRNSAPEKKR